MKQSEYYLTHRLGQLPKGTGLIKVGEGEFALIGDPSGNVLEIEECDFYLNKGSRTGREVLGPFFGRVTSVKKEDLNDRTTRARVTFTRNYPYVDVAVVINNGEKDRWAIVDWASEKDQFELVNFTELVNDVMRRLG